MSRSKQSVSAWVAALAMMLNALWPLIAQAEPRSAPVLHAICTVSGIQLVQFDGAASGKSSGASASSHCAFCSLGTDRVAIAPFSTGTFVAQVPLAEAVPALRKAPLRSADPFTSAHPRAPPPAS